MVVMVVMVAQEEEAVLLVQLMVQEVRVTLQVFHQVKEIMVVMEEVLTLVVQQAVVAVQVQ
jgi:hypothetical protein